MSSTFDEFQLMLYQHPFDIITLSETWLRNDSNLLQYVQIPGYSLCYKNREERRGDSVGMSIKDTIKYKEQQDLSKEDETIKHMWKECQVKNKNKNYLVGVFYQPCPEDKEKLIWIQKLDTILSAITTTWNKTIVIEHHAPLKRTKFTRRPAPWIKQLDIIELQKQRNKYRFLAHSIPSKENWMNFRNAGNRLKKKNKIRKLYLKPKGQNSRGRYKCVKQIFQSNRKTSNNY